ncbi:hypothetical protein LTR85_003334 [Meristemomyces frigidus]|nr:hypothetical protein LTR85_003334 [Meristemomyces frigidus]
MQRSSSKVLHNLQQMNVYLDEFPFDTLPEEEQDSLRRSVEETSEGFEYIGVCVDVHAWEHGDVVVVGGKCSACTEETKKRLEVKTAAKAAAEEV